MQRQIIIQTFTLIITLNIFSTMYVSATERPDWVEAEGEAYQSEIDTPKEVMERAIRDAESKAIEKALGVFLRSHTLVSNSQLAEDLVYAAVRGKIEKIETIISGWDEKDRNLYRVRLKALVSPVYPEKGQGISLKLSLSKTDLKDGDELKIFYQTNVDCYIYIFSIAADGSVTLLLPNSIHKDNFIKSETVYEYPMSDGRMHLQAKFLPNYKSSFAEEKIKIIATKKKEDIIPLGFHEGMFKVYDAQSTGMISDLVKRLNQLDPSDWAESTVVYKLTRPNN